MNNPYKLFLVLSIFLAFTRCHQKADSTKSIPDDKPNIVLIVADDHGTDDLGCYGNTAIQTPNLDKLASEGVRFTKAYCTTASCSASRLSARLYSNAAAAGLPRFPRAALRCAIRRLSQAQILVYIVPIATHPFAAVPEVQSTECQRAEMGETTIRNPR